MKFKFSFLTFILILSKTILMKQFLPANLQFSHLYAFTLLCLCISLPVLTFAQQNTSSFRLAFYNVENLFDYFDESLKKDDSFTPRGANHWTKARYEQKITHLYQTIIAMGNPLSRLLFLGFVK